MMEQPGIPALKLEKVRKNYDNFTALDAIDLEVAAGEFCALLGPNGAGKSTIIGIISALVRKTSGRVLVCGVDMDRHPNHVKRYVGVVPQEINLNQFEKVESVLLHQGGYFGLSSVQTRRRAQSLLEELHLTDKRHQITRNLSGGMRRRLMIARALVHEPKLLILDEPTAGVDIEIRRGMWAFLQELNRSGTTIILTTHYLEEAEFLCNRLAILDEGKIVEDSSLQVALRRMQSESFLLYLEQQPIVFPSITGCTIEMIDPVTLEISVPVGQTLSEVFSQLLAQGVKVSSMRNKSSRLEAFFVGRLRSGIQ